MGNLDSKSGLFFFINGALGDGFSNPCLKVKTEGKDTHRSMPLLFAVSFAIRTFESQPVTAGT